MANNLVQSLITSETRTKVSSVLNRDVTNYGKQFLTDHNHETCWNSDQGTPQFIIVDFHRPVKLHEIRIMFQGGFAGKKCSVYGGSKGEQAAKEESKNEFSYRFIANIYPEDGENSSNLNLIEKLKIVFESSTDFFGRITIYDFDLLGQEII
ncbi:13407_t:CDS:2 [Ambispora leptoticha]|uniref:13407_t:CDS:1 n=1 Tax=Ambispora leptoticha TaxID=144679 RepID=A0A9N8W6M2_9GLOM|nr:13407_t:CDS:2 [Ambispora leptoticha]